MRGKRASKRKILPDPKYKNIHIAKFINYLMQRGKKSIAQSVVYGAFDILKEKTKQDPLDIFDQAIKNITPALEVKSRRVGGANYQIPIQVRGDRKLSLTYHWIIDAARNKKGKPMEEKLAAEILAAYNNEGDAIKKKLDMHRMAEANKAFAHFAR
jgi:small subunit ribosomal protein S7